MTSNIKSGDEILDFEYPEPVWVINNILPSGLTIMAGRPKIGKSWIGMQIAFSTGQGGIFFEQKVEVGKVLYLALEDNERRIQDRMRKQQWTKKAAKNTSWITMEYFRKNIGPLHRNNNADKLYDIVKNGDYKLVVIDTLSRAFMGLKKIEDSQEVTAALSPLQETAITKNFSILIIDHHNKATSTNAILNPIDDILGSTAKAAVLDTAIGIYKDRGIYRFMAEGREVEKIDLTIEFDNHTGCWQSKGKTLPPMTEVERTLYEIICTAGKLSFSEIHEQTGMNKGNLSSRLTHMASQLNIIHKEGNIFSKNGKYI